MKRTLSVIVPAYNEELNLQGTVREIHRSLRQAVDDYEIIIVNDNSLDRTGDVANKIASSNPRVVVIHNTSNLGLGGAYKQGLKHCKMNFVMMIPGDNVHPAEGIIPIVCEIGSKDVVIPYVTNQDTRKSSRQLISRVYTNFVNFIFDLDIKYYNGLVVHKKKILDTVTIETNSFSYQTEALVKILRRGASYVEVGVIINEDKNHKSSALRFKNIIKVMGSLFYLTCEERLAISPKNIKKLISD